jgi:hypothetical protein
MPTTPLPPEPYSPRREARRDFATSLVHELFRVPTGELEEDLEEALRRSEQRRKERQAARTTPDGMTRRH